MLVAKVLKLFIFLYFQVISWLHTQGNECLQRHLVMADNLKGIRTQQKDFEKFYYAAMVSLEKIKLIVCLWNNVYWNLIFWNTLVKRPPQLTTQIQNIVKGLAVSV